MTGEDEKKEALRRLSEATRAYLDARELTETINALTSAEKGDEQSAAVATLVAALATPLRDGRVDVDAVRSFTMIVSSW